MGSHSHNRTPVVPASDQHLTLDISSVQRMTMAELRDLQPILNSLADVAFAFSSQKHLSHDGGKQKENWLFVDEIGEMLCAAHDAVYNAAKAMTPGTPEDIEARAWCLLAAKVEWRERLGEVAAIAAEAAFASEDAARFGGRASA